MITSRSIKMTGKLTIMKELLTTIKWNDRFFYLIESADWQLQYLACGEFHKISMSIVDIYPISVSN